VFKRLVKSDVEVDLYTARLKEEWALQEETEGINVIRSPKVYKNFITKDGFRDVSEVLDFSLWVAKNLFRRREYDLVEANHCPIFPAIVSWARSKLKKIRLTVTFHEAWHDEWHLYVPKKMYVPFGIVLEKALTWLPDIGIAVSNFTAKRLVELFEMKKFKITVIPNGVDLDFINKISATRDRWKIIYVGRLNPHKKVEWLIEAFKMLKRDFSEATLEIVGDGPMYTNYLSHAEKNNVEDVVFKKGVGDKELVRSLKSSRVYVLPSIREGQSITTLEAMVSGTPQIVVEANGNGAADLVSESASGIMVRPKVTELYNGIKKLLEEEETWKRLSENGYKYASNFTWSNVAQQHKDLYESLLGMS
jgi:glycosyltransferase involved in cell wall biosynthesis